MKTSKKDRAKERSTVGLPACIWSKVGAVSVRTCTRALECRSCLFDQNMTDFFVDAPDHVPAVPQAA
jgi:hypothetical protein